VRDNKAGKKRKLVINPEKKTEDNATIRPELALNPVDAISKTP
jgi:hypothetical protein